MGEKNKREGGRRENNCAIYLHILRASFFILSRTTTTTVCMCAPSFGLLSSIIIICSNFWSLNWKIVSLSLSVSLPRSPLLLSSLWLWLVASITAERLDDLVIGWLEDDSMDALEHAVESVFDWWDWPEHDIALRRCCNNILPSRNFIGMGRERVGVDEDVGVLRLRTLSQGLEYYFIFHHIS